MFRACDYAVQNPWTNCVLFLDFYTRETANQTYAPIVNFLYYFFTQLKHSLFSIFLSVNWYFPHLFTALTITTNKI